MARRPQSPFTTIRSEGALLPPELLSRIADADKELPGLAPSDYWLAPTERVGEAISRSWNRLIGLWATFDPQLAGFNPNDPGTGATRDRWLMPLLSELGFAHLPVAKAIEIEGTSYPISHQWEQVPVHLIGAGLDLDRRTPGVAGAARTSPHSLMQDYLNRTPTSLWGIVSNGKELRLLRDNVSLTRQAFLSFDLEAMFSGEAYSDFALLWLTCHRSRFDSEDGRPEGCNAGLPDERDPAAPELEPLEVVPGGDGAAGREPGEERERRGSEAIVLVGGAHQGGVSRVSPGAANLRAGRRYRNGYRRAREG